MAAGSIARRARRGISFLEFLGCFVAVAGGVVLGSMYLGVDVQHTAVTLLQRAQVISTPAEDPAAESALATTPAATPALLPPQAAAPAAPAIATTVAKPVVEEPAAPNAAKTTTTTTPALTDVISFTPEQRDQLTRAYWDAFNECLKTEAESRSAANQVTGEWELYDYLSRRSAGHQTAADAIAQLSLRGVDAHIAAYAERVLDWHEAGATLFARAKDLLTDAPTAQLNGPFAQSWQSAATQHQMEERLLKEKQQSVQAYLDHAAK